MLCKLIVYLKILAIDTAHDTAYDEVHDAAYEESQDKFEIIVSFFLMFLEQKMRL